MVKSGFFEHSFLTNSQVHLLTYLLQQIRQTSALHELIVVNMSK